MDQPLLTNYYSVIGSPRNGNFSLRFNPEHPIFDGHFPGMPVVPGVTMIQIMLELAARQTHISLRLVQARKVKFLFPINPREQTQVEFGLTLEPREGQFLLNCTGVYDGRPFFKFTGTARAEA